MRWLLASALAAGPAVIALVVLAALGHLPSWATALACLGVTLMGAGLSSALLGSVRMLERYSQAILRWGSERNGGTPPAPPQPWLGRDLAEAFHRQARLHEESRQRLTTSFTDLERALEALPTPLLLVTDERTIVRANRAAEALLGTDIAGRDLAAVLRSPTLLEAVEEASHGLTRRELEFSLAHPVERTFLVHVEALPEPASDGSRIVIALVDQTAARRMDQMRADFVANASHEIRTPLATLIGFIETLQGPARDDAAARERFLAIMAQNAGRMARLVDDLLSLSKIEMNEHSPPTARIDLAAVARSAINNLAWQAKALEVAVRLEAAIDPAWVVGDESELTLAAQNLIGNAIKYGRESGTVTVRINRVGSAPGSVGWRISERGAIALAVEDQGEGIAREHLPRLTERFYRVDTARSRELGGTGLGLAIVKHIMNRHRGTLSIDSTLGKGSTFALYLEPCDT